MESNLQGRGDEARTPDATGRQAAEPGAQMDEQQEHGVNKVRSDAKSRIAESKDEAARTLSSLASALHDSADRIRDEQHTAGDYVGRVAGGIDKVAQYLSDKDLGDITGDLEDAARRNPAAFIGGAFALGLIGARFLKNSRRGLENRQRSDETARRIRSNRPFVEREIRTATSVEGFGNVGSDLPRAEP